MHHKRRIFGPDIVIAAQADYMLNHKLLELLQVSTTFTKTINTRVQKDILSAKWASDIDVNRTVMKRYLSDKISNYFHRKLHDKHR